MKTSDAGRKFIETQEGCILSAYDDKTGKIVRAGQTAAGTLTIGYGHTSAAGAPKVTPGMKINQDQADQILAADLASVEADVQHLIKVPLNQNQFDALVSFQFNTGALGKASCSVTKALNGSNYTKAADALLKYNEAGGKVNEGLSKRREAEKKMFLSTDHTTVAQDTTPSKTGAGTVAAAAATAAVAHGLFHTWWITLGVVGITVVLAVLVVHLIKTRGNH